jgi:transcription termination factor Rho
MSGKRKKRGPRPSGAPHHAARHGTPRHAPRPTAHRPRAPIVVKEPPAHAVAAERAPTGPVTVHEGILELHPKGYGFLRSAARNYLAQPSDPYVPAPLIQKLGLREGMRLAGPVEAGRGTSGPRLIHVDTIEEMDPHQYPQRKFDDLTPIDPTEQIRLETGAEPLTTRVMDLLTPIGKGQRGLIVAPPRTGKTVLLEHIARAVAKNHPEMHLVMLLVDERPEEVTEMRRIVKGEVIASSSDKEATAHIRMAELVIERARRLVEQGKDVFVLLDSLTRLARAYNKNVNSGGRTLSGGVDIRALDVPKRLFGTARKFEEGGSLTVLGTALIETGSRMDDVIFQEFKGTGNMELVLNRQLADRRIYPAIDLPQSGTRKEERILQPEVYKQVSLLRRSLAPLKPVEAMEALVKQLGTYPSNAAFLSRVSTFMR